jgi:hypothetical protein
MKNKLTTLILVLAVLVFSSGIAVAQFANRFFNGMQDYPLPDSPCGFSHTETATPLVFNNTMHVLYTCSDGKQWVRNYYDVAGTGSTTTAPPPTTYVPPPAPAPTSCTTVNPGPAFTCVNGNWLYTG